MPRRRPTHRAPLRLVLTAAVHLGRLFVGASAVFFAGGAVITRDPRWLLCAAIFGAVALLLTIIHTFEANSARCAVCSASLFARTRCTKHKNARRLFGSHRLHAACNIILFYKYRCHHCGELVVLDDGSKIPDEEESRPPAPATSPEALTGPIPPPAATVSPPAATVSPPPTAPQPIFPQAPGTPPPAGQPAPTPFELTPPA